MLRQAKKKKMNLNIILFTFNHFTGLSKPFLLVSIFFFFFPPALKPPP